MKQNIIIQTPKPMLSTRLQISYLMKSEIQ
jgi:hypothetical protein